MNGPKHYQLGESFLVAAEENKDPQLRAALRDTAQAHFTAALVAAQVFTALNTAAVYNVELNAAAEWIRTTQ